MEHEAPKRAISRKTEMHLPLAHEVQMAVQSQRALSAILVTAGKTVARIGARVRMRHSQGMAM
jgi:hypothetical protein